MCNDPLLCVFQYILKSIAHLSHATKTKAIIITTTTINIQMLIYILYRTIQCNLQCTTTHDPSFSNLIVIVMCAENCVCVFVSVCYVLDYNHHTKHYQFNLNGVIDVWWVVKHTIVSLVSSYIIQWYISWKAHWTVNV